MVNTTLEQVTGEYPIDCNGEYVVLYGKDLWVFRTNGTFVAYRPDITNPYKVTFLSDNRLLISGGKNKYHLVSLTDGSTIWEIPQKKREGQAANFALSHDELFAYDYYSWINKSFLVKLDIENGKKEEFVLIDGFRSTRGIICDENDIPCLLQCQTDWDGNRYVCQQGIFCHSEGVTGKENTWKCKWNTFDRVRPTGFLKNIETIMTDSLCVWDLAKQAGRPLIDGKDRDCLIKEHYLTYYQDISQRYITLVYQTANVVIDCWKKKVVACYTTTHYTFGCLIGNEYWICIDQKIVRKAFPIMEQTIFAIKPRSTFY